MLLRDIPSYTHRWECCKTLVPTHCRVAFGVKVGIERIASVISICQRFGELHLARLALSTRSSGNDTAHNGIRKVGRHVGVGLVD